MSKIRINELARELEVPNGRILELLPELGVTEKKTHSSSIDEDVAVKIRHIVRGDALEEPRQPQEVEPDAESAGVETELDEAPAIEEPVPAETAEPLPEPEEVETAAEPVRPAAPEPPRRPQPLRPPISLGPREPLPPGPSAPTPAVPTHPAPGQRNVAIPAKPVPPAPRPGQILSGPRQPLPAGFGEPPKVEPGRPVAQQPQRAVPSQPAQQSGPVPSLPRPPVNRPAVPPAPGAPSVSAPPPPRQAAPPSQPQAASPSRPLAGQPAARPVVPPRPDLVDRLNKAKMPAAPAPPRPGMPTTRPPTPVPGQPIYRGPIRPGQPIMRGPGAPGAPGPGPAGRPLRQRMHPTSPLRMEPPTPPPTDQQRRDGKRARPQPRRDEPEERALRLPSRREEQALPQIDREITIADGITVKELSEKLGVKANLLIKKLVERKIFATINQSLEVKLAEELARQFGASTNKVSYEQEATQEVESAEDPKELVRRAPVVTIMGHVDHGKTSLLDAIRETNVAEREAGGITQHIGAYHIEKNGRKIVFIDTPGHEAFTRMRARGAKVTDVVILVVAADDGVMPQTLEAIDHARAAGVPIIVAINKIDKGDAQPERIKQQLADRNLLAEDWGGDVVMVPVSAKSKTNLDLLLEMVLLVADMLDLKANPSRPAMGSVLEAQLDRGRGPVATVLVRNGTLRVGDFFICGSVFSKVRAMFDDRGRPVKDAEPSMPVEVLGLDSLPEVGDAFQVVTDTAKAKQIVIYREAKAREQAMAKNTRMTLDQLHQQLKEGEVKDLNLIIKADVGGSAEVVADTVQKLSNDKVRVRVLHTGVGAITETDVLLASTSDAIIIGFNVRPERAAAATAEREKVDVRLHTIIYDLTDEIKRAMTGMLEPVFKEVYKGRAAVRETYRISKVGMVAGCMVLDGTIPRDSQVRLLRDNVVVHTGKIASLKRFKNDASEVKSGFECGISLEGFNDIKLNDVIEAFVTERVAAEALV
jgi:translation initiation factor IF-2